MYLWMAQANGVFEDEWAALGAHHLMPGKRRHSHEITIHVVHVTVLGVGVVHEVLLHGDLGAIEDGGLVHVIPSVQVLRTSLVILWQESASPIITN